MATRELTITYGNYEVSALLDAQWTMDKDFARGSIEYSFLVQADTESAFGDACVAADVAFRTPFQALTIVQGSKTLLTSASNALFDCQPRVIKREDDGNTGRSRMYRVRIDFGLPADVGTSTSGLRSSTVSLLYETSRRRKITIRGVFTAITTSDAVAQYTAQINAYCAAVIAAMTSSGAYEVIEEEIVPTMTGKTAEFSRTYHEILYAQGTSGITEQILFISRRLTGFERSPNVNLGVFGPAGATGTGFVTGNGEVLPLITFDVRYVATVDADLSGDLAGKWNAIRGWILNQVKSLAPGGLALIEERPEFEYDNNRIAASMVCQGVDPKGGGVLALEVSMQVHDDKGLIYVAAWGGVPLMKYKFQGGASRVRTTAVVRKRLLDSIGDGIGATPGGPNRQGWDLVSQDTKTTRGVIGRDGQTIDVLVDTTVFVEEYSVPAPKTGTSGPATNL